MKKLTMLAAAAVLATTLAAQPSYTDLDTLMGRNPRYHYSEWYDSCATYYSDTADFTFRGDRHMSWEETNPNVVASEHRAEGPLMVVGLAAFVSMDTALPFPSKSDNRAAEYMMIYQAGGVRATTPWALQRYYPRELTLLDSVRWDTATPYIFKMPRRDDLRFSNADTDFAYCYVYEAYFATPVTVDSMFYIAGTHRSNCIGVVFENGYVDRWLNWPTSYGSVEVQGVSYCDLCPQRLRIFGGFGLEPTADEWVLRNFQRNRFTAFLPIVARP